MSKSNNKNILGAEYMHEVVNVSRIFGRQHDIKVVIEGDAAGVDREGNIVYPSINADAELTPEQVAVSRGFVDHECGHKRYTDLGAFFDYADKCRSNNEPLKLSIANGIEDPRMEAHVIKEFQGSCENLTAVADSVCRKWCEDFDMVPPELKDSGVPGWPNFVTGALSILGRHDCWGFDTDDYKKTANMFSKILGKKHFAKCREFSQRIPGLANTREAIALAEEVGDWIKTEYKEPAQSQDGQAQGQSGGQGESGESGESGEGSESGGDGNGEGQSQEQSQGQSQGSGSDGKGEGNGQGGEAQTPSGSDSGSGSTAPNGRSGEGGSPNQSGSVSSQSGSACSGVGNGSGDPLSHAGERVEVGDGLNKTLAGATASLRNATFAPYSTRYDSFHTRKGKGRSAIRSIMNHERGIDNYKYHLAHSAGKVNVIRRKLERVLQAEQRVQWDGGKQHGRLDSRKLVAAFNRQEKVFKRKQESPALNTAVTFLLDLSHSMHGNCIQVATQTLVCLAEALEKTSVQYNVLGHTIGRDLMKARKMAKAFNELSEQEKNKYTRHAPLDIFEFKSFNERLGTAKKTIGNIPLIVHKGRRNNGNVDHEALWHCYNILSARPEKRHVLVVISDGMPNPCSVPSGRAAAEHALRKTVKEIEGRGVEVIGIGIFVEEGKDLYTNWHTVHHIDDLATTVIDELAHTLIGRTLSYKSRGG